MTDLDTIMRAIKAQTWEDAKGKLRAMAAIQGSYPAKAGNDDKWEQFDQKVEAFITDIEDWGLQE